MNIKNNNLVSIVVPVYNESENIKEFIKEIDDCLINNYEIIFVCDPSEGSTEDLLKELSKESPAKIKSIIMSRRFGQHKCIIAGLKHSAGEAVLMDVDGQDPVSIIPK